MGGPAALLGEYVVDGGQADMNQAAQYIDKNCNINQEFSFVHPMARLKLNKIYNCHFSGCQRFAERFLWNLQPLCQSHG